MDFVVLSDEAEISFSSAESVADADSESRVSSA